MARKDRTGNRKGREQNRKVKVPELGYYLIVTDTEGTERCFFQGFDEIIAEAECRGINVGWSNPCFEIWMYAYFGVMPAIQDSWTCCSEFSRIYENKTGQKYAKADGQLYTRICRSGDEQNAIKIAQQKLEQCIREGKTKPSAMCPGTRVFELVGEIKGKL